MAVSRCLELREANFGRKVQASCLEPEAANTRSLSRELASCVERGSADAPVNQSVNKSIANARNLQP